MHSYHKSKNGTVLTKISPLFSMVCMEELFFLGGGVNSKNYMLEGGTIFVGGD